MDSPTKIHILLFILLIVINSWIAYRLFNLEGIEGNTDTTDSSIVRINDGSSDAASSAEREAEIKKKKEEEKKKADLKIALDYYNNTSKPEYDAKLVAYKGCVADEARKAAYERNIAVYNIEKPKHDADVIAYEECLYINKPIKGVTFKGNTKIIGKNGNISKDGIHGLCIYNNKFIMCDFNSHKIYFYSEQNGVWVEETNKTLDVASVAPNPTGVCVTRDGKRLIVVSRGKSNVCISTMNNEGFYSIPIPIPNFNIDWPVSPSMTPDGRALIVPQQRGPSIFCGIWNGSSYDFKKLSIPIRSYFGCCINDAGNKIAYTSTDKGKVYVTTLTPLDGFNVIEEKEIGGIRDGFMREVRFTKTNENVLFVTSVGSTNNSHKFQYSMFNNGAWGSLVSKSEPIPDNFDNTGMVIGDNNTVYISQYSRSTTELYKFNYTIDK